MWTTAIQVSAVPICCLQSLHPACSSGRAALQSYFAEQLNDLRWSRSGRNCQIALVVVTILRGMCAILPWLLNRSQEMKEFAVQKCKNLWASHFETSTTVFYVVPIRNLVKAFSPKNIFFLNSPQRRWGSSRVVIIK